MKTITDLYEANNAFVLYFVEFTSKTSKKVYYKVGVSKRNFKYRWDANDRYKVQDGRERGLEGPLMSMKDLFTYKIIKETPFKNKADAEKLEHTIKQHIYRTAGKSMSGKLKAQGYNYETSNMFFKGISETFPKFTDNLKDKILIMMDNK